MIKDMAKQRLVQRAKRKVRVRSKISGTAERPRLAVTRSLKNFTAQLIDDVNNKSLLQMTTVKFEGMSKTEKSEKLGAEFAAKAIELGVSEIVFDRSGYLYHGRVKAFADKAREAGLKF